MKYHVFVYDAGGSPFPYQIVLGSVDDDPGAPCVAYVNDDMLAQALSYVGDLESEEAKNQQNLMIWAGLELKGASSIHLPDQERPCEANVSQAPEGQAFFALVVKAKAWAQDHLAGKHDPAPQRIIVTHYRPYKAGSSPVLDMIVPMKGDRLCGETSTKDFDTAIEFDATCANCLRASLRQAHENLDLYTKQAREGYRREAENEALVEKCRAVEGFVDWLRREIREAVAEAVPQKDEEGKP